MNTLRRMIFFLFILLLAGGAYQVSANHYAITDASFTSAAGTSFVVGTATTSITVTLNITNTTTLLNEVADYDDVRNVTVTVAATNGSLIQLGINDSVLTNVAGDEGNSTYAVEVTLNFSQSNVNEMVVPSDGVTTLNITFDIFNLTGDGDFNESIGDTDQSFTFFVRGPEVTIKFLDINNNEKTTFPATDKVKIVCTRSSPYSTINFNDTNISINVPGGNTFDSLESSTFRASASTDFEVEFTQTRELGDYTVACLSIDDNAFLNDTTNKTFTIVAKLQRGGAAGIPGFIKPTGQKIVSGTEDLGTVSEQGVSRLVRKGASLKVDVKGETHTVSVKELSPAAVTLTIESTPQDVTINKGETKEVDVDGDGQNDFAITFHQQFKSGASATADITLKAVSTPAEPKKDVGKQPATTTEDQVKGSFAGSAIVTVLVIIAVIVIGFALIRGKKK